MKEYKTSARVKGEWIDLHSRDNGVTWYDNQCNRINNKDIEFGTDIWPLIFILVGLLDLLLYYILFLDKFK